MTASLPGEVQRVFERFRTSSFVTVDAKGRPGCRSASASYSPGDPCIDVRVPLEAGTDEKVALLFSDPEASGMEGPPQVLVQGTAATGGGELVRVRPERVFVWPEGDATREPQLYDAHMEEVRSGHDEEAESPPAASEGGDPLWDERLETAEHGVLSIVAPDGFPFAVRVAVSADPERRQVLVGQGAIGVPVRPGPAQLDAGALCVRADLDVGPGGEWVLLPRHVAG
jgi:hypothetical protein